MAKIGVSKLYYAKQTLEETASAAATYGTPVAVPGLVSIEVQPASQTSTLYADNGPYETASGIGEVTVNLDLADVPLEVQADLLGHTLDSTTHQLDKKTSDVAPYVALMFEFAMGNGSTRCVKLYKGKFALPNESGNTKTDTIEYQTSEISASFVQLKNNQMWESIKDYDAGASTADWYTSVL